MTPPPPHRPDDEDPFHAPEMRYDREPLYDEEDYFCNLPEKEQRLLLFRLMREIKSDTDEHVRIAREYKKTIGDPINLVLAFGNTIRQIITWLIGGALTLWGLKEILDGYKKFK